MSTTMVETWVQELAQIGPIYPFVGHEGLMVLLLVVCWLGWHIWQLRHEKQEEDRILERLRKENQ